MGIFALILLVAAFVSILSATNECCNPVFCKKLGRKTFNAGAYLLAGWITFIFGVVLLYFGSMTELNADCGADGEMGYLKPGVYVCGGLLGFVSIILGAMYYLESLTLAAMKGESGLLKVKRKPMIGNASTSKPIAKMQRKSSKPANPNDSANTEMVSIHIDEQNGDSAIAKEEAVEVPVKEESDLIESAEATEEVVAAPAETALVDVEQVEVKDLAEARVDV